MSTNESSGMELEEYMQWLNLPEDDPPQLATDYQIFHAALSPPPSLLTQTGSLPFNAAPRLPHAEGCSTPAPSSSCLTSVPLWRHGELVAESHPPVGLGIFGLARPACPCPCVDLPLGSICAHQLHWDEAATEDGETYPAYVHHLFGFPTDPLQAAYHGPFMNAQSQSDLFGGELNIVQHAPQLNIGESGTPSSLFPIVPSPAAHPRLQRPSVASTRGLAYDAHFPMPPTPVSHITTPEFSGASSSSPESPRLSVPASSPRKKRPYTRPSPSGTRSVLGSSMEPDLAVALDNARKGVRQFVKENPRTVEPPIGNQAAMAIMGSDSRLGTPGKSLYSAFFSSSRGKPPFTCYDCGHVETRFSRAVRHQRQEHFEHYPYLCQGGSGHPACGQWFASDEYAKDHVKKAGPTMFSCSICSKVFPNSGNLGRHKKLVHHA